MLFLLVPLARCAPTHHSHDDCDWRKQSLDSALSTFLYFTEEQTFAMEETDKKKELAAKIAPYLKEFNVKELVSLDNHDLVSLVNLVFHEDSVLWDCSVEECKVVVKTRKQHFDDLVKLAAGSYNLDDPNLLNLINCQYTIYKILGSMNVDLMLVNINGKILFPADTDITFPPGSFLHLSCYDTSNMDGPSVILGGAVVDVSNKSSKEELRYTITTYLPNYGYGVSMSATINVGWKRAADGLEWIRKDYFNDTSHTLNCEEDVADCEKDISVVHYDY